MLEPAAEVAGAMLHPTIRWTIARLLRTSTRHARYVAVTGPIAAGKTRLAKRLAAAISGRLIVERPDWARLGAFYADPAGQGLETELEFLNERARLLGTRMWREQRTVPPSCATHGPAGGSAGASPSHTSVGW